LWLSFFVVKKLTPVILLKKWSITAEWLVNSM